MFKTILVLELNPEKSIKIETFKKELSDKIARDIEQHCSLIPKDDAHKDFVQEIRKRLLEQFSGVVMVTAFALSEQPSRAYYEAARLLMKCSKSVKGILCTSTYEHLKYDYVADAEFHEKRVEQDLEEQYGTEIKLWDLMDAKKYEEAASFLKMLEIKRAESADDLKAEFVIWKEKIALQLGDVSMLFEILEFMNFFKNENLEYDKRSAVSLVYRFVCVAIKSAAKSEIAGEAKLFDKLFLWFVADKMTKEIFETKTINSSYVFKSFLSEKMEELMTEYILQK